MKIHGSVLHAATHRTHVCSVKLPTSLNTVLSLKSETGIEGLVHVSEMDWTNKNVDPKKVVQLGDEVEVMVLEIDEERRRISLGMKQCKPNPWEEFAASHQKGRQKSAARSSPSH